MKIFKHPTAQTVITTGGIQALGLVNAVVLARWLEPVGRGEVAAALLWPMLLVYLGSVGLFESVLYFASKADADLPKILGTGAGLSVLLSLVLVPMGYLLMPVMLQSQSESIVQLSRGYLVVIPISLLSQCIISIVHGRMALRRVNFLRLLIPIGYLFATVSLFVIGELSSVTIVYAQLILNALVLLLSLLLVGEYVPLKDVAFSRAVSSDLLTFGFKSHIGSVASQMNNRLDQVVMAGWLSPTQLGLYVAAISATSLLQVVPQAFRTVMVPRISRYHTARGQVPYISRNFRMFWVPSVVLYVVFAVAMPWLLPFVYGSDFDAAVIASEILLLAGLALGVKTVLTGVSQAVGQPLIGSRAESAGVVVTVGLLVLLVPRFGIEGAAMASLVAYTITVVMLLRGLRNGIGLSSSEMFGFDLVEVGALYRSMRAK